MPGREVFTTIRSEGALLPADFLKKVVGPKATLEGLSPADYHLPGTEKLNEAASRAWNHLIGVWAAFQSASRELKPGDRTTTITREKWLLPLFQELGYGRLQAARAAEIEGRPYPLSHSWQQTPIHLVGRDVDLDRRTPGVAGAARTSPHGLLQEFLNRSEGHLWGMVSNGLKLRLLRDNRSFTRQAFLEFDLGAMMDGQVFADFVLLWIVCHQSRVEGERPDQCWLEKWTEAAKKVGTRALDDLRDGVQRAIEALGRGFLKHQANVTLKGKLAAGSLTKQDYYRQLLREVYRLIFLFVAEDRELLLVPDAAPGARERYNRFYSVTRLRNLAERRRGTQHDDLWRGLSVVFAKLSSASGCTELGLPALGSFLWSDKGTPDLDARAIANADLLDAIRALAFTAERGIRRAVDYRNLGPEELGSVYESLLELHPELSADAGTFALSTAAGHERKTTGSYYTPTSLIDCLLDSAVDPVLDEAAKKPDGAGAILELKVCDPACGSGHFLLAAAHRIANRLAAVRTGDEEASPGAVRSALREVVGHCLYGVDVNPMAVELCKVNLWLETLEPGKPLSFLEHHIQCGNSLLGATPVLLRGGIPDAAFDPIEGDDREYCRELKKRNRRERDGFRNLFTGEPWERLGDLATGLANLDQMDDSTLDGVRQKESRYADIVRSTGYAHGQLWADAWCGAFVWPKAREAHPITEDLFRTIERNPMAIPEALRREIRGIAEEYRFFHWHLAFPDIFHVPRSNEPLPQGAGWDGGFDLVLGNPPWERIKIQEKEWFADRRPEIAEASNAAARKKLIERLATEDPALWRGWHDALRRSDGESVLVRSSGRYPLCGRGDVNTYAIFAELNRSLIGARGRAGFIVPTGIATDDTTKLFFQDLVTERSLQSLYSFFETRRIFIGTDSRGPFCLLTLRGAKTTAGEAEFAFDLRSTLDLSDPERRFNLSAEDIALLNPNTHTCPIFRTRRDAELTKAIYRRVPVFVNEAKGNTGNPWGVGFLRMLDMATDSNVFQTGAQLEGDGWELRGNVFEQDGHRYLPLYEAKMVHHFTHRFGDYADKDADDEGTALPDVPASRLARQDYVVRPRYWVPESAVSERLESRWSRDWVLGWRDICRSFDERTVIATVIPRVGVGHTLPLVLSAQESECLAGLSANLCAFAFDYIARQKVGGTHLTYLYMKQLPVLAPTTFEGRVPWSHEARLSTWTQPRVLELTYTACDLGAFARDLGWQGAPFRWDPERRFLVRCELDAAFFHLYGIARDDVHYVMETFPIVRRSDEAAHGEYRTKRVILEIYDRMLQAIESGQPYKTILDPPPADSRCCHVTSETAEGVA
jgi:hypothetical protein